MNSNCNCAMSVLKKQCPREVFDCHRCYAKMKNTGRVWQVATPSDIKLKIEGTTEISFEPFTEKLYWDSQLVTPFLPGDVDSDAVKCVSSIWAKAFDFTGAEFSSVPSILGDGEFSLGLSLYFETNWRLVISILKSYGGGSIGGFPEGGFSVSAIAQYASEKSNCFIFDPASFSLSETSKFVFLENGAPDDSVDLSGVTLEFPETISFQHVDKGDFNPDPAYPV